MKFDFDFIIKILSVIGISSLFYLVRYFFRGVSLVQTSAIERLLSTDQRKIMIRFLESFFYSIFVGTFTFLLVLLPSFDYTAALIAGLLGILLGFYISLIFKDKLFNTYKNYAFYIKEGNQKLYIHKVTSEEDVIMSKSYIFYSTSEVIIQRKDYLYGKEIYCEYISESS